MDLCSARTEAERRQATYEEIKTFVTEHNDGRKVSNLYIAQVKAKYGIIECENYNKAKSDDARQPQCPKKKKETIVEELKRLRWFSLGVWQYEGFIRNNKSIKGKKIFVFVKRYGIEFITLRDIEVIEEPEEIGNTPEKMQLWRQSFMDNTLMLLFVIILDYILKTWIIYVTI